jgi:hypothetical protein
MIAHTLFEVCGRSITLVLIVLLLVTALLILWACASILEIMHLGFDTLNDGTNTLHTAIAGVSNHVVGLVNHNNGQRRVVRIIRAN